MKYPFEDYETAESFIEAIESNPNGHYPIGASMFWHSGIHIFCDSQKEFEPLIGGKVVCYRISEDYRHVKFPASLGKEELEGKWSDYKEFYDKKGKVKDECKNETYPISDCFILLEHSISINGSDFTFYTLYMNLAPACDNPNYKELNKNGTIHGHAINPDDKEFFVDEIGSLLPAKDKKQIYFDLVVLSKQSIEGFSSTDIGRKAFWGITKTTGFYTRKQPFQEEKPIKIFIPNWTEFDCEEYADDGKKAYKITLKSFHVYFDDANAVKNRKLTDTSKLCFSRGRSNGSNNEDIWNPTEEKKYITDIVRNEVLALKGKEVDYHANDEEKFWYIKVVLKQPVTVWTREKVTKNDIFGKVSFVIDGYTEKPLAYQYKESDCSEDIKSMVSDISETPLPGADGKNYYKVEFRTSQSEEYFVCEPDRDDCMASLLDFKKWFYFCKESDSILCDRTGLIKDIIEKHDTTVREAMLMRPTIGIWWKGRKLKWDRLKYVYGSLSSKNDSLEGMLTKLEIRKAVCRHPIEWDKNQFSKLKENILGKPVKTRLENEASEIDLWNGGLDKIFSNSPYFYHPIYFINHLDKAGLFEFNPYAGMKYKDVYGSEGDAPGINMDAVITWNPGFAPIYVETTHEKSPNVNGYSAITGFFNQDYSENYKDYKYYYHEGVDFRGPIDTEIHALIYGMVIDFGTHKNRRDTGTGMGDYMVVQDLQNTNKYYVLVHLLNNSWEKYKIKKGTIVTPKTPVACVGTQEWAFQPHLHVSIVILNEGQEALPSENTKKMPMIRNKEYRFPFWNDEYKSQIKNPFNHEEEWKGRS